MSIEKFGRDNFNPLVSIVIPVYNGSNYVREAIDSALAQTYKNIEIVVVNDGSTDNSEEIIKSYGNKLRYFKKENGGVATALNLAIKKSKGEYISWLSHDDLYYPDKIEKQIGALKGIDENKRNKTILYSNWILIDKNSRRFDEFRIEKRYDVEKLNYPLYPILKCIVHGCTLLIPKKCFDEVDLFDPKLRTTQDYDLWFKMFPKYNLLFQPYFFVKFRNHDQQGTNTIKGAKGEADVLWKKMVEKISSQERILLEGSDKDFYIKLLYFAIKSGYIETEKYVRNCMREKGITINEKLFLIWDVTDRIRNKFRRIFFRVF